MWISSRVSRKVSKFFYQSIHLHLKPKAYRESKQSLVVLIMGFQHKEFTDCFVARTSFDRDCNLNIYSAYEGMAFKTSSKYQVHMYIQMENVTNPNLISFECSSKKIDHIRLCRSLQRTDINSHGVRWRVWLGIELITTRVKAKRWTGVFLYFCGWFLPLCH